jgi:cell pole-organizing protein PopZ
MASSPQHEPTMEEILASIRKIISEDSSDAPPAEEPAQPVAAAPAPVPEPAPAAPAPVAAVTPAPPRVEEPEDDVMELTDEMPEPAPAAVAAPAAPMAEEDLVFEAIEEPAMASPSNSDIFSDKTRKAIDDTFANLDAQVEAPKSAPSVSASVARSVDGDSVEAVFERAVRDAVGPHIDQWMDGQKDALLTAMRPLIREWMDEHFPALLEGAVRDEVARAVKARGR